MIYCLTFSCKNSNSEKRKESSPTVLIFDKAPDQLWIKFEGVAGTFGSGKEAEIAFVDSMGLIQYFTPNRERDTLTIYSSNNYIEIFHVHRAFENLYFYIKSGDTVLFTYDNNKYPSLKSNISEQLTQQYNFRKNIPDRLSYFDFEPLSLLSEHSFWRVYTAMKNNEKNIPRNVKALYVPMDTVVRQAKIYLQNYASLLEKQYNDKMICSDVYNYHRYLLQNKTIGKKRDLLYYSPKDSPQHTLTTLDEIYDGYFNDEYHRHISYLHSIDGYLLAHKFIGQFPFIVVSNGSYCDYRIVFDSISSRTNIPPKTHAYMLSKTLDNIIKHFSVKDIEHYTEKYIAFTGDSLRTKNKLLEQGITETKNDDIQLKDLNGNEVAFQTILEQLKGKVIYLNFWASWCAPCRSAMPEAFKLRKDYESKDVAFVYLAFNDREDAWKKAINDLQLNDNRAMNYFIVNSKSSKAIEELKIESIPRYLIYDKTGKIVNAKAQGPYGVEIRKMLDELLLK
jgi:thiol-disulfide isomerase/thioredoxin